MLSGIRKAFAGSQYVKQIDGPPRVTHSDGECKRGYQSFLCLERFPNSRGDTVALTGMSVGVQHVGHVKNIRLVLAGFKIREWDEFSLRLIQDRFFKKEGSSSMWFDPFMTLSKVSSVSPEFPLHADIGKFVLEVALYGDDKGVGGGGTHEKFACETKTQKVDINENTRKISRLFGLVDNFDNFEQNLVHPTRGLVVLCRHVLDEIIEPVNFRSFDMENVKVNTKFYFSKDSITVDETKWHIYVVPTPIFGEHGVTFCDPSTPATSDQIFDANHWELNYTFRCTKNRPFPFLEKMKLPNDDIKIAPLESWNLLSSLGGKTFMRYQT